MSTFVLPAQDRRMPSSTFAVHDFPVRADQRGDVDVARATRLPLGSNNPFLSASEPVSPISPVEEQQSRSIMGPNPRHPAGTEKSVDLRQLEGSSYGAPNTARKVRVAQDMYNGQNPPKYESPIVHAPAVPPHDLFVRASQEHSSCRSCGLRRTPASGETGHLNQTDDCIKCGKRQASMSVNFGGNVPISPKQSSLNRVTPIMAAQMSMPSTSSNAASPRTCCNKCGRKQRSGQTSISSSRTASAGNANVIASSARISQQPRPLQKSPSFGIEHIRPKHTALPRLQSSAFVKIDVTPPTASTYRPVNSPFPDDSPLLDGRVKKAAKPSRSASIASAISRTFSRRKSKKGSSVPTSVSTTEHPLPSQRLQNDGEHSPGRLVNMITHAIRGDEDQDYAKLGAKETKIDRPDSPFSFTDKPAEDEAFEMNDMRISKLTIEPDYDFLKAPYSAPPPEEKIIPREPVHRPEHLRSKTDGAMTTLTVPPRDDVYLADPTQRPTITRFKSLRVGVERAASVTRSTSLRRLNSIKKAPELWYRTDMSLEGAVGAY